MRTKRPLLILAVPALLAGFALAGPQTSWETSFERQTNERQPPAKVLPAIGVRPGLVIGEVGAGRGRYTVHLARAVGEGGKVYAEDINADSLDYLRRRCQGEGIRNVETILGRVEDPLFPPASLDMAFMVLTYHHLANPVELLKNLIPSLRTGATIVIIDPDPEKDEDRGGHESTSADKMRGEAFRAGLRVVRIETFLERDNIFILQPKEAAVNGERAAVPVCGLPDLADAGAMTRIPIWAFNGELFPIEPAERQRRWMAEIVKAGGHPIYTEYPGVEHDSFQWAYTEPALVEWLFAQRLPHPGQKGTERIAEPLSSGVLE